MGGQGAGAGEGHTEKQVKGCLQGTRPSWAVRVLRTAAAFGQCLLHTLTVSTHVLMSLGACSLGDVLGHTLSIGGSTPRLQSLGTAIL